MLRAASNCGANEWNREREGGIKAGREREEIISVMLILPRRGKERRAGGLAGYVPRWLACQPP